MPILDLQRRMHQIGRIRIGQQVPTSNGKTRPAKLSTFRFTSQDAAAIAAAAKAFGGDVRRWEGAPTGEQWEVISEAKVIPVVVPPAATAFSQWYEQWSGGGCVRRCDGETELLTESPCLCATEDERICTPHTRLNVILRDLPGLGVWRLDTSGWNAATELAGTVEVIVNAATRGQLLPAVLRLEEREAKRPGESVKKFAVPVLDIQLTPSALGLVVGQSIPEPAELPAAAPSWQPIPPPAELAAGNAEPVAEQIRQPRPPEPKRKPAANAAEPIRPTGLQPRGANPIEAGSAATISDAQMKKLRAAYNDLGVTTPSEQKRVSALILDIPELASHSTLTVAQASKLIDRLEAIAAGRWEFVLDSEANVSDTRPTVEQPQLLDPEPAT